MQKAISTLIASLFITVMAVGQEYVTWTAQLNNDKSEVLISAEIADKWFIYSQHLDEGGPIPTEFVFGQSDGVAFNGEVQEITKPIKKFDELFEMEVLKFKNKAEFSQKVTIGENAKIINLEVTYMTCDSERCLPPRTIPLTVKI